jgi:four helix bundle protein
MKRKNQGFQILIPLLPAPFLPASYEAAFIAKLNDSEAETAETQTWLKFAVKCSYLDVDTGRELYGVYNRVLGILVTIINNPSPWLIKR